MMLYVIYFRQTVLIVRSTIYLGFPSGLAPSPSNNTPSHSRLEHQACCFGRRKNPGQSCVRSAGIMSQVFTLVKSDGLVIAVAVNASLLALALAFFLARFFLTMLGSAKPWSRSEWTVNMDRSV